MHKPSPTEITETLRLHSLWLLCSPEGKKADFSGQDLRSANLGSADLRYANLSPANLCAANLSSANLGSADLRYANLRYANLYSADLRSANLYSADLRSANLGSADLSSADLGFANLSPANLCAANLSSANLGFANLCYANLRAAKYSKETRWPKFSVLLSAYWPNEDKEIETWAKPKVEALLSKYLVLEAPAEPEPKPSCEGKVVEIDGIEYILKRRE